jgi:hypothetical protein
MFGCHLLSKRLGSIDFGLASRFKRLEECFNSTHRLAHGVAPAHLGSMSHKILGEVIVESVVAQGNAIRDLCPYTVCLPHVCGDGCSHGLKCTVYITVLDGGATTQCEQRYSMHFAA